MQASVLFLSFATFNFRMRDFGTKSFDILVKTRGFQNGVVLTVFIDVFIGMVYHHVRLALNDTYLYQDLILEQLILLFYSFQPLELFF